MFGLTRRLFTLEPEACRGVGGLALLNLVVTATYVCQGLLVASVLASAFNGDALGDLAPPVLGVAAVAVVRAALLVTREAYALHVSGLVKQAVRSALTRQLLQLGPGPLQHMRTGGLQSTMVDGVEHLDPLVGRFVPQMFAAVIGAVAVTTVVIWIDPLVGMIILVCALAAPFAAAVGERWMRRSADAWSVSYRGLYAENLDAVQGMATLKAFNASRRRGEELSARADAFCIDSIRVIRSWITSASVPELAVPIGTAVAIGLGALHAAQGRLTLAELFTILLLSRECFRPLHDLQTAYHSAYSALPASRDIFELLDTAPDVCDAEPAAPVTGSGAPSLEFVGLTFAYRQPSSDLASDDLGSVDPSSRGSDSDHRGRRPALDGFDLRIEPGEWVALVGRSGAGKSTLVSLLMRWFDPDEGSIRLDGADIRSLSLEELRAQVGVVAQDTFLFHGTVRDNLRLSRRDAADADIETAARAARAHDFVEALPQGYDTIIGERGTKLSGGERQRIAIARALLKDAPVLVLDEPTSAVDAANEAEITKALETLTEGRTTLLIAHRLSTVLSADRIVVVDQGRVVEVGTHQDLLARQNVYATLVAAQAVAL